MIKYDVCNFEMEYDEGEGNIEDGYTCYSCIDETEKMIDEVIDNQIEEMKIRKGNIVFNGVRL